MSAVTLSRGNGSRENGWMKDRQELLKVSWLGKSEKQSFFEREKRRLMSEKQRKR